MIPLERYVEFFPKGASSKVDGPRSESSHLTRRRPPPPLVLWVGFRFKHISPRLCLLPLVSPCTLERDLTSPGVNHTSTVGTIVVHVS